MARFSGIPSAEELRERKRNEIIRCASLLFAENGYEKTALTAVAAEVGVTKTALYHYVSSKEELLFLCQRAVIQQALDITTQAMNEPLPPVERLHLALSNLLRAVTGQAIRYAMIYEIFDDSSQIDEAQASEIRAVRDQVERKVRALVKAAIADGSFEPDTDPKLASFMLLGTVTSVNRWYRPGGAWSLEHVSDNVARLALRSFMTTSPVATGRARVRRAK